MANNKIKVCKNQSTTKLRKITEAAGMHANNGKYIFQGVFTACSTPEKKVINRNQRVYTAIEMCRHLGYLRDRIKKDGCILGELDHPEGRFDVNLKEASHKIIDLWYDEKTACVMGKIELLDTPNGKIAKQLVDSGFPIYVSSRAAGDVDEKTQEVEIAQIFTYDIVCTPGFEEARLARVNESLSTPALKYINESLGRPTSKMSISEAVDNFVINEDVQKYLRTPINMKKVSKPLNEDSEEAMILETPELNPVKVQDESPENPQPVTELVSENEEDKQKNRAKILGIVGKDKDDEVVSTDNKTVSDSDKEKNRAKILGIEGIEADPDDEKKEEKKEETAEEKEDKKKDEEVDEAKKRKDKVSKDTDDLIADLDALMADVSKTEAVKESILRRYPFAAQLTEANFNKFSALRPNLKKKCSDFIIEHNIVSIRAINELWNTPLHQEKKRQENWLKLARPHDIKLYNAAPKEVQDAIEESAKYVILESQEDVNDFWNRTGLRQMEYQRQMNEEFIRNYKTGNNSPYNKELNEDLFDYGFDYVKMTEDMWD